MEGAEHWPRFSAVSSSLEEPLPGRANMNEPATPKTAPNKKNSMLHKKQSQTQKNGEEGTKARSLEVEAAF